MVNWSSPEEITKDAGKFSPLSPHQPRHRPPGVFQRLIFIFLGIVLWEIFTTLGFEWSILSGRRRLKWPMVR